MRTLKFLSLCVPLLFFIACKGPYDKPAKKPIKIGISEAKDSQKAEEETAEDTDKLDDITVDMDNKGVGPIDNINLEDEIDQDRADAGEKIFSTTCIACHQMDSRMVGPALKGVTEIRAPEWIMNMILAPDKMLSEDPIAQELLEKFGSPMTNMGLSEDEAREILEYFRSYDQ